MHKKLIKILWIGLLSASYGMFTYSSIKGWWVSSMGTLLMLFFGYLYYKRDFLRIMGLEISWKILIKSFFLTALIILCAWLIMKYIGTKYDISIQYGSMRGYYHIAFYTLNEEIFMGAMLIYILKEKMKAKPLYIVIGLALFFACIHFVFYKWIFIFRCNIHFIALLTLLGIGVLRNVLIITTRHIGYSWALHFGWMAVMFGSNHYYVSSNIALTEPERFNTYLGSYEMLVIAILLAAGSWFLTRKKLK